VRDGHSILPFAFLLIMNRASDKHFNGGVAQRQASDARSEGWESEFSALFSQMRTSEI
jgi:hypothetical protein